MRDPHRSRAGSLLVWKLHGPTIIFPDRADVVRWTWYNTNNPSASLVPKRDRAGLSDWASYGSPHPGGFNVVFCDGSIRSIAYSIDPLIYSYLGNRRDGRPVDASKF